MPDKLHIDKAELSKGGAKDITKDDTGHSFKSKIDLGIHKQVQTEIKRELRQYIQSPPLRLGAWRGAL